MPNIRQTLYSDVLVALSAEPQQAAIGPDDDKASTPVARGLPGSWDEIAPGHLVIAQESLANGWWEAIVLDRKDDMLTLRFRDYPRLPRFFRHRTAVALISPAAEIRPALRLSVSKAARAARAARAPAQLKLAYFLSIPTILEVRSWTRRLRASAR